MKNRIKNICILTVLTLFLLVIKIVPVTCLFKQVTGIYCPACGMTRAFITLLEGNILKSLYYNPTVIYILGYVSIYMIINTICKMFSKEMIIKYSNFYLYLGIFIMMLNFIIRNILLLGYGISI